MAFYDGSQKDFPKSGEIPSRCRQEWIPAGAKGKGFLPAQKVFALYNNSHKDFPKSGETLGQTRASAAHNSEIVYESRYKGLTVAEGTPLFPFSLTGWCRRQRFICLDFLPALYKFKKPKYSNRDSTVMNEKMRDILLFLQALLLIFIWEGCKKVAVDRDYIAAHNFPIVTIDSTTNIMASDLYLRLAMSDLLEKGGILDSSTYFDTLNNIVIDSLVSVEAGKVHLSDYAGLYQTYLMRFHNFYITYIYKNWVEDSIAVDSAAVDSFYHAHPETFSYREQVHARQLVVSAQGYRHGRDSAFYANYTMDQLDSIARETVYKIKEKIDSGAEFGQMANEYSMHRESGDKDGELGYFFRNTYNKEFEDVAFSLPPGTISEPFKSPDGWHIVQVIDHVDSGFVPLTPEIYQDVAYQYTRQLSGLLARHIIDSLILLAHVVYNDSALSGNLYSVPAETWAAIINGRDTIDFYRLPDYLHQYKSQKGLDTLTLAGIKDGLFEAALKYLLMEAGDDIGFGSRPEVVAKREELYHKYAVDVVEAGGRDRDYKAPDSLIADYYQRNMDKFVVEKPIYVQHIITQDSLFGEFLRDQALSGVDFMELAKEHYPGDKEIRTAAADLGYIGPGEMPDNFYQTALGVPVNGVSHPVKTQWGYHIIKVLDRRYSRTLEQVKGEIAEILAEEHQQQFYLQWRKNLMAKYVVEYHLGKIPRIELVSKDRR
jgi:parvulin-like peptidyl-prolyl isomerase